MNVHKEAFIKAFIVRTRQERFLGFLADPKKRRKFKDEFNHLKPGLLAPEFTLLLRGSQSLTPNILKTLQKIGAPQLCWAIGTRFDGQEKMLSEMLQLPDDSFILSCIPGRLAYVRTEDDDYILRR